MTHPRSICTNGLYPLTVTLIPESRRFKSAHQACLKSRRIEEQVKVVASPRNHQERTVASPGGGGRFLLGKSKNLGQCAHDKDLALPPLPTRMDFYSINKGTDGFYNLRAYRLI